MKRYNIQIYRKGLSWEETPFNVIYVNDYRAAAKFARALAHLLNTEIRVSQGPIIGSQGSYFF